MAISKKATLEITDTLDRVAGLFSQDYKALGVPARVASDLVGRIDAVSDYLWKQAGIPLPEEASASNGGEDPEQIGKTEGPAQHDSDEGAYMQHFDQGENRELQEKTEGGGLGKGASALLAKLAKLNEISDADFRRLAAKLAEDEEDEDGEEASKKASFAHGFNLYASDKVTDKDIRELKEEAGKAGDREMVEICEKALKGDKKARKECEKVILENRAE